VRGIRRGGGLGGILRAERDGSEDQHKKCEANDRFGHGLIPFGLCGPMGGARYGYTFTWAQESIDAEEFLGLARVVRFLIYL
jgi:hypothetical protein